MLHLEIDHLTVSYNKDNILEDINASFTGSQMISVIGCNGAGKTTLLKALARMVHSSGSIRLFDDSGQNYSSRDISYLPQLESVESRLTVYEIVLLGLVKELNWRVTEQQERKVDQILRKLGIHDLAEVPICNLSGGQKQLVFMAQAMVSEPKVLLMDEPTSALDLRHQLIVMDLAASYTREAGIITLFVIHDLMLAARYGDQLLLLEQSRVKMLAEPEKVLHPDLLESVYQVSVEISHNQHGFIMVTPLKPL
jgi:iron complex transport system ATP-binding protein